MSYVIFKQVEPYAEKPYGIWKIRVEDGKLKSSPLPESYSTEEACREAMEKLPR